MQMDILEARQFFADFFYGEHHVPGLIKPVNEGFYILMMGELATTDYNDMTRLVLMAHARCIRVCVRPCNFRYLRVSIFKRDPTKDNLIQGHPSLIQAIERHAIWMDTHKYSIIPAQTHTTHDPKKKKAKTAKT